MRPCYHHSRNSEFFSVEQKYLQEVFRSDSFRAKKLEPR
jgi:hypothetical protein